MRKKLFYLGAVAVATIAPIAFASDCGGKKASVVVTDKTSTPTTPNVTPQPPVHVVTQAEQDALDRQSILDVQKQMDIRFASAKTVADLDFVYFDAGFNFSDFLDGVGYQKNDVASINVIVEVKLVSVNHVVGQKATYKLVVTFKKRNAIDNQEFEIISSDVITQQAQDAFDAQILNRDISISWIAQDANAISPFVSATKQLLDQALIEKLRSIISFNLPQDLRGASLTFQLTRSSVDDGRPTWVRYDANIYITKINAPTHIYSSSKEFA